MSSFKFLYCNDSTGQFWILLVFGLGKGGSVQLYSEWEMEGVGNARITGICFFIQLVHIFLFNPLDFIHKYVENINCCMRCHIVMKLPRER